MYMGTHIMECIERSEKIFSDSSLLSLHRFLKMNSGCQAFPTMTSPTEPFANVYKSLLRRRKNSS